MDQNFIEFEERDLFLDESFRHELQNRMKEGTGIKVPCVFFQGVYIGVSTARLKRR
jgi:glutaredoxin